MLDTLEINLMMIEWRLPELLPLTDFSESLAARVAES